MIDHIEFYRSQKPIFKKVYKVKKIDKIQDTFSIRKQNEHKTYNNNAFISNTVPNNFI